MRTVISSARLYARTSANSPIEKSPATLRSGATLIASYDHCDRPRSGRLLRRFGVPPSGEPRASRATRRVAQRRVRSAVRTELGMALGRGGDTRRERQRFGERFYTCLLR